MVLDAEEVGVSAGFELRAGPVELVDLRIMLREGCSRLDQSTRLSWLVSYLWLMGSFSHTPQSPPCKPSLPPPE